MCQADNYGCAPTRMTTESGSSAATVYALPKAVRFDPFGMINRFAVIGSFDMLPGNIPSRPSLMAFAASRTLPSATRLTSTNKPGLRTHAPSQRLLTVHPEAPLGFLRISSIASPTCAVSLSTVVLGVPPMTISAFCGKNRSSCWLRRGAPSSNNRHRGPCARICLSRANCASDADFSNRAVFCFSDSRLRPNFLLDSSSAFERSLDWAAMTLACEARSVTFASGLRRKAYPITARCAKRGTGSNFAAFAKVRACTPFCPVRIILFEISDALH